MVSRLDHRSYEKRVFKLLSSDDSFDEENDIKIDYQTNDGDIVCYYSLTLDSTQLIEHPNIKWFHPGYFPIVLSWIENEQ